jgi:hypothetical protein
LSGTDERIVGFIGAYSHNAEGCTQRGQLSLGGLGWHVVWRHALKLKECADAFQVIDA